LTDLRNDPELRYGDDFVKNDLLLAATNIQNTLDLIDKDHRSVERYITEAKDTVEFAFECYIRDLERSLIWARSKLEFSKLAFAETEKELIKVNEAKKLFLEESGGKK
jgi:hypothetical protein